MEIELEQWLPSTSSFNVMSNKEFKKFEERRIQISKINILLDCYSFMQGDKYKNIKKSLPRVFVPGLDCYLPGVFVPGLV